MSSTLALLMALLVLLPMHACNARPTFAYVSYTKDAEELKLYEMDIEVFPIFEKKETISSLGADTKLVATLDENQRAMEMKGLKRNARSMLESASHKSKEPAHSSKDEPVEDVVVTDYVQPHRKSPIHNNH